MNHDLDRIQARLTRLEREARAWRTTFVTLGVVAVAASCNAPQEPPTALDFASEDGTRHVHVDGNGIQIAVGERSSTYSETGITAHDGDRSATLAADGVVLSGSEGRMSALHADSLWVSQAGARAELTVEAGHTGLVRATGEDATSTLAATSDEATLTLRSAHEPVITAMASATVATVAVSGTGGTTHNYGAE